MHGCNATREPPIVPCRPRPCLRARASRAVLVPFQQPGPFPRAEGSVRGLAILCVCRSRRVRRLGPRPRPLGLLLPPLVDGVCIYLLVHRPGSVEGDSRSAGSGNRSRPIGTRDDSPIPAGSGNRDATGVQVRQLEQATGVPLAMRMRARNPRGTGVHRDSSLLFAYHHPLPRHGHSPWVIAARRPPGESA